MVTKNIVQEKKILLHIFICVIDTYAESNINGEKNSPR